MAYDDGISTSSITGEGGPITGEGGSPTGGNGRLRFEVVDVFTDRAFSGNPLAVVYDSDGLSTEQLRRIAMEFNLSETTFPYAPTDEEREAGADYRVRIFTPAEEIPFAGHPTLGTAWSLRRAGQLEAGARHQLCGAGLIGVQVSDDETGRVELSAAPRDHAGVLSADASAAVASLVGLTAQDLVTTGYGAGCGLSWLYLQVGRDALDRSRPSGRRVSELRLDLPFLRDPYDGIAVYAVEESDDPRSLQIEARVYVPGFGIPEDPATGSAAAGLVSCSWPPESRQERARRRTRSARVSRWGARRRCTAGSRRATAGPPSSTSPDTSSPSRPARSPSRSGTPRWLSVEPGISTSSITGSARSPSRSQDRGRPEWPRLCRTQGLLVTVVAAVATGASR